MAMIGGFWVDAPDVVLAGIAGIKSSNFHIPRRNKNFWHFYPADTRITRIFILSALSAAPLEGRTAI